MVVYFQPFKMKLDQSCNPYKDDFATQHKFVRPAAHQTNAPKSYPVINIYHHRRTADEPMYQIVKGEPIQVIQRTDNDLSSMDPNRSGLSSLKPSNNERERNLTDADKEFIAEIEEYIKNLVKHVNQGSFHFSSI